MKIGNYLRWSLVGWLAGIGALLIMGYLVLPAVIGSEPSQPGSQGLLILVLLIVSPFAIAGGIAGGRIQAEGGSGGQLMLAAILGLCAAVPFSCLGFWYTGW